MTTRRAARARAWGAVVLLTGLVGGLAAGPAVGVTDDPAEGGLWYYTVPGFEQIHASGVNGEGITVAVIDGPIYPDSPDLAGTNLILPETSFCDADRDGLPDPVTYTGTWAVHATGLAAVIIGTGAGANGQPGVQGVAPDATVRLYVSTTTGSTCELDGQAGDVLAIDQAIADGADIINLSFTGWGSKPDGLAALARAQRAGVILVAASNNQGGTDLGWPALGNGVIAVEAADMNRTLSPDAVAHPQLAVVAPGVDIRVLVNEVMSDDDWHNYATTSGSSLATAWTSGVLALAWSAYPDATANQMIQALLRTTSQSDGELTRVDDHWGYGTVNARNLVAIDPTTLPDVNPLLRADPDAEPSYEDIVGPDPEPTPGPTSEPTEAAPPPTDPATAGPAPAMVIALVALVVLAGATTATVLIRRRTAPTPAPPTPAPPTPPTSPTQGG